MYILHKYACLSVSLARSLEAFSRGKVVEIKVSNLRKVTTILTPDDVSPHNRRLESVGWSRRRLAAWSKTKSVVTSAQTPKLENRNSKSKIKTPDPKR